MTPLPLPTTQSIAKHPVVWGVIVVCLVPFTLLETQGLQSIQGWFLPDRAQQLWQPLAFWRLWSPTFVHYTIVHLLTNIYLWWLFGSKIEAQSRLELVFVAALCALVGNLSEWWLQGPNFGGLSGVVYGLMGYLWLMGQYGGRVQYKLDRELVIILLLLIPICATGWLGKYANYGHLGGLLSGVLLAVVVMYAGVFPHHSPNRD